MKKFEKVFGDFMTTCRDTKVSNNGTITVAFYDAYDLLAGNAFAGKTYSSWAEYAADVPEAERDITLQDYRTVCQVRPDLLGPAEVKTVVVHSGMFHLDDLAVAALCRIANPDCVIIRDNKPSLDTAGPEDGVLIADVGGIHDPERWLFDHHQDRYDPETADKATVRAAVGRVWDALGNAEKYPTLTTWIRAVDCHDTGVQWSPLGVFGAFAPKWNELDKSMDQGFEEALDVVQKIIIKMIENDDAIHAASTALDQLPVTDGVLRMEKYIPWQGWAQDHPDIKAVVTPGRNPGEWNVNLPKGRGKFPASWLEPANKPNHVTFVTNWLTMVCVDDLSVVQDLVSQVIVE